MVNSSPFLFMIKSSKKKVPKVRLTISLPMDDYEHLLQLSAHKNVSLAWLVREAINEYNYKDAPILKK